MDTENVELLRSPKSDVDVRESLRAIIAEVTATRESLRCKTLDEALEYARVTRKRILSCNEPDELADAILSAFTLTVKGIAPEICAAGGNPVGCSRDDCRRTGNCYARVQRIWS